MNRAPAGDKQPYRGRDSTASARGEGAWFSSGVLYSYELAGPFRR